MQRYTLRDAQNHLKKLIADAQYGETVVILDENDNAVQLVPVMDAPGPRQAGSARGQVKLAPDFDDPLSDFSEYAE